MATLETELQEALESNRLLKEQLKGRYILGVVYMDSCAHRQAPVPPREARAGTLGPDAAHL